MKKMTIMMISILMCSATAFAGRAQRSQNTGPRVYTLQDIGSVIAIPGDQLTCGENLASVVTFEQASSGIVIDSFLNDPLDCQGISEALRQNNGSMVFEILEISKNRETNQNTFRCKKDRRTRESYCDIEVRTYQRLKLGFVVRGQGFTLTASNFLGSEIRNQWIWNY